MLGLLIITLLVIVALSVALVVQTYTYNQEQAARDVSDRRAQRGARRADVHLQPGPGGA